MKPINLRVAEELGVREQQVAAAISLLDDVRPARADTSAAPRAYAAGRHRALRSPPSGSEQQRVRSLRRSAILESISQQGKLDAALKQTIEAADSKARLEDLYLPFRPKRRTKAQIAREAGLEPRAEVLLARPNQSPEQVALRYIEASKGVVDSAAALEGARAILIERFAEDVRDNVRDKLDYTFEDLGEQQVKNIARPVRVYRVRDRTVPIEHPLWASSQPLPLPDKPSVAVLPFTNMSGDPEQEYFADGIAEDVITALSRYPSLCVIARTSSFTYKGRAVGVRQVGCELGVRYVLEGGLRKSGNRIRITAQLVDAETGKHIWAERYDRDPATLILVQIDR